jgi:hypothetical protein
MLLISSGDQVSAQAVDHREHVYGGDAAAQVFE